MATNLVMNVKNALTELPEPAVYGWLDSTVALHWILGNGQYHQYQNLEVKWRYVPVGLALNPLTYQPRSTYKYPIVIMQQFS